MDGNGSEGSDGKEKQGDENTRKRHVHTPHSVYPDTTAKGHAKKYKTDWLKGKPLNGVWWQCEALLDH